jgi:hypothetical protein
MISFKTNPYVCPKKPIKKRKKRVIILNSSIAIAPMTGETPVSTALNDLDSFRYSLIGI